MCINWLLSLHLTFPRMILRLRQNYECGFWWLSLKLPRLESTARCTRLPSHTMEKAMQNYPQAFSTLWAPRQMSLLCQTLCCHGHAATGSHQAKGQPRHECLCEQESRCLQRWPQAGHTASVAELTGRLCFGEEGWTIASRVNHWWNC